MTCHYIKHKHKLSQIYSSKVAFTFFHAFITTSIPDEELIKLKHCSSLDTCDDCSYKQYKLNNYFCPCATILSYFSYVLEHYYSYTLASNREDKTDTLDMLNYCKTILDV